MKLHSVTEMGQQTGVCCRQSRLRGASGALLLSAILVGAVFLLRHWGTPWFVWGGCAAVACLFVPIVIRDALAKFRSTNWVLRINSEGLWINLRTSQQWPMAKVASVVQVSYDEIDHAHRHIDTWTTPSASLESHSVDWKLESLDLHLVSDDTRNLALVLAEERTSGKELSPSVTLPAPGVIRIAWRGHGLNHDVVPTLDQVLSELRPRVTVTDTTRTERPNWRKLSEAELNEQVELLVRWGDQQGACELLMGRRGYSATEAHKFVTELATRI
jgi:hypothetical protein